MKNEITEYGVFDKQSYIKRAGNQPKGVKTTEHGVIWGIPFFSTFWGLFFGVAETTLSKDFFSPCAGAFDARIISNSPSSVRKAVLFEEILYKI